MISWHLSDPALRWIERYLHERLGVPVALTETTSQRRLVIPGTDGAILFDRPIAALVCGQHRIGNTSVRVGEVASDGVVQDKLPAPGLLPSDDLLILEDADDTKIRYDIPGLIYWALTRREELDSKDRDAHGRFPAAASHAVRHGYLARPVVDEWVEWLRCVIRRKWPTIRTARSDMVVDPTHDVDRPFEYRFLPASGIVRQAMGDIAKRRDLSLALRRSALWLRVRRGDVAVDPFNTFDWIMDESEHRGLQSTFYFLSGGTDRKKDAQHDITHPAVVTILRKIHARGHGVALHPSYTTWHDAVQLDHERIALRTASLMAGGVQEPWGARMHYLRWEAGATWRLLARVGIAHDATVGYADQPGFRAGTCHEYQAFDPVTQCALPLRVRPLILMDDTLFSYLGITTMSEARTIVSTLRRACQLVGGRFSILWHNSNLATAFHRDVYLLTMDGQ